MATFTKTVDPNGGSDYLSISAWQAGEKSLYASGDIAVAVCKRTGATKDTTAVTITGWTAGVIPRITVDPLYKHEGKWADTRTGGNYVAILTASAGFAGVLTVATSGTEVSDLLVENTGSSGRAINLTSSGGTAPTISRCLVRAGGGGGIGIASPNFGNGPYNIRNCVAYSCATGFFDNRGDGNAARYIMLENCTAYGCTTNGINGGFGTVVNNCISVGSGSADFVRNSSTPGGDYNASSDATAFGTHVVTGKTSYASYFVSAAAGDLHLLGASSSVLGLAGTSLSVRFTDDIDGATRSVWDLGVDEYSSGSTNATATPAAVVAVAGVGVPTTVVPANATATPAKVTTVTAVSAPIVTTGTNVTATPAMVSGVTAVGAPTLSTSSKALPATVVSVAGVGAPTVVVPGASGNHLTVQEASAEDGTTTGFATAAGTLSNSTTFALHGTHSIRSANDGGGFNDVNIPGPGGFGEAVTAGNVYTAMVWVRAGTTGETLQMNVKTYASGSQNNQFSATGSDVSGSWTQLTCGFTAPSGTTTALIQVVITGAAVNGELHYFDQWGMMDGSTTTWSLPSGGGTNATATPATVAGVAGVGGPTVSTGQKALPTTAIAVASVGAPTVTTPTSINANPVTAVAVTGVGAPTTTATKTATATPAAAVAVTGVAAPTVSVSSAVTASPATAVALTAVGTPAVSTSATADAVPTTAVAVAGVAAPAVSTGHGVSAVPSTAVAATAVAAPTMAAGEQAAPATVVTTAGAAAPAISTGDRAAPASVIATAAASVPAVSAGSQATPTTVVATAAINTPATTVSSAGSAAPATVVAVAAVGTPTVTTTSTSAATAAPIRVSAVTAVAGPIVSTGQQAPPVTAAAITAAALPTVSAPSNATASPTRAVATVSAATPAVSAGSRATPLTFLAVTAVPGPAAGTDTSLVPATVELLAAIGPPVVITVTVAHIPTPVFAVSVNSGTSRAPLAISATGAVLAINGRTGATVAPSATTAPTSTDGRTLAEVS